MAKKRFVLHPDTIFIAKVYGAIILGALVALVANCCDAKLAENKPLKQNQSMVDSVAGPRVLENATDTTKFDLEHKRMIQNVTQKKLEKQK